MFTLSFPSNQPIHYYSYSMRICVSYVYAPYRIFVLSILCNFFISCTSLSLLSIILLCPSITIRYVFTYMLALLERRTRAHKCSLYLSEITRIALCLPLCVFTVSTTNVILPNEASVFVKIGQFISLPTTQNH